MSERRSLPQVKSPDWLEGWKTANIVVYPKRVSIGFLQMYPYTSFGPYVVDEFARCLRTAHAAPYETCHCGFNAFVEEQNARAYRNDMLTKRIPKIMTANLVMLRVGLAGRVIAGTYKNEDDWTYRGQRQRIDSVFVPPSCAKKSCRLPAMWMGVLEGDEQPDYKAGEYFYLRPLCVEHITEKGIAISLDECTAILKVPFLWDAQ